MSSVLPDNADPHVFLVGRPPMGEYIGFITSQTVGGAVADQGALADRWRRANDHIQQLEADEAGLADSAAVTPLPSAIEPLRLALLTDPAVQRTYGPTPVDVTLVDLDTLVVFQKHINLAYVRQLQATLPERPTDEEVFGFALPTDGRYNPPVSFGPIAANAWGFTSPSTDLRVLDLQVIDPSQVAAPIAGVPAAVLSVFVGYGSNLLSAVQIENRLVLANGSHRAYALRDRGHRVVPCLIRRLTRREELNVVGVQPVEAAPALFLDAPRPPLLKDYFDDELRMLVDVPRKQRQVQVQVATQQIDSF